MKIKKVRGVDFNVDALSSLSLSDFKRIFKKKFGEDVESVYYEVSGKTKEVKKPKVKKEESGDN